MQDKETFEYAIIRVVPKVEREEFFNVGVILFSKRKKFLDMKYFIDPKKLEAFSCSVDFEFIEAYLKAWKQICAGAASGGAIGQLELPERFRWLVSARSTIIQSSPTHSGLCHDPEKVLEGLFEFYVL